MPQDGIADTRLPRLSLIRSSRPTVPVHTVYEPSICLVAQGRKRVLLGDAVHEYDAERYLVAPVDLPLIGQVIEASPKAPYLCICLVIDRAVLGALAVESGFGGAPARETSGPILSRPSPELVEAAVRLVRLLETPEDIGVLGPMAEREFLYRLLKGEQGARLAQIAFAESRINQVHRAIGFIKTRYREAIRIDDVAAEARMSLSALHEHFKAATMMSPLQYQKQLRLQEARRMMLAGAADAAGAGFAVGYESPSQFSREYARLFGAPPIRDVERLRGTPELDRAGL
jgi:AraC-like DNA-binding protein